MNNNLKYITALLFIFILDSQAYAQTVSEGIYNNEPVKYYKDKLIVAYKPDSINSASYMNRANDFILTHDGSLDSVYYSSNYLVADVTLLPFNADAIKYIDLYKHSSIFEFVSSNGFIGNE